MVASTGAFVVSTRAGVDSTGSWVVLRGTDAVVVRITRPSVLLATTMPPELVVDSMIAADALPPMIG